MCSMLLFTRGSGGMPPRKIDALRLHLRVAIAAIDKLSKQIKIYQTGLATMLLSMISFVTSSRFLVNYNSITLQ